jgi:pyruvate decarboxylase
MATEEVSRLKQEVNALQQEAVGANAGEPIYLGQYLLQRLEQLGVTVSHLPTSVL